MIVIFAIGLVIFVAACCWPWCSRARRGWRQRQFIRAEAAQGIARLEILLAERAPRPVIPPRSREGDGGKGESASNPKV
jgi:hypothetical protein